MLFPYTMFYSNACWAPLVKCWDLSLLLPLTQTLCPNQCIRIWRGSSSPVIILWVIPPSCPFQTKKMGQVRVSHSMNIDAAPLGQCWHMYLLVRLSVDVSKDEDKDDQLGFCIFNKPSSHKEGWTGRAPSSFTFRSLKLLHKLLLFLKMCTVLKCHAHTKACN